jgi:hypothetical protein
MYKAALKPIAKNYQSSFKRRDSSSYINCSNSDSVQQNFRVHLDFLPKKLFARCTLRARVDDPASLDSGILPPARVRTPRYHCAESRRTQSSSSRGTARRRPNATGCIPSRAPAWPPVTGPGSTCAREAPPAGDCGVAF